VGRTGRKKDSGFPIGVEHGGENFDFFRPGNGEVVFLGGIGCEVVEFDEVRGLVLGVRDDELGVAVDQPAPAEARDGVIEIEGVVGEAFAVDRFARGDGGGVEEVDAGFRLSRAKRSKWASGRQGGS